MGVVKINFNPDGISLKIQQIGQRAIKHGVEEMRDSGEEIAKTAQEYAPHNLGNLEEAIKVLDETRDSERSFRREVNVGVDPSMPGSPGQLSLAEYALYTHEGMAPFGDGTYPGPGKGTRAKGPLAGGKYLERAYELHVEPLKEKLGRMYRRLFK